ncbi:MAG: glutamine-hydrolyzing carbamoyl-phosphate synthase small subunit [Kiritimatiellae bacterium]|nr:glutamine-hydrolyzing carbamoyl-phosphate synthase small subunit [Kiritimatiellia bacterium]
MKNWNWKEKRTKPAFLALENGTVYRGFSAGAPVTALGEVVFNTGLTGYQEILTDPSYAGQFVTMTCPEIGNTGINGSDMESRDFFANGFLAHQMNEPSSWRSEVSLRDKLIEKGIPCLTGFDTRALTTLLRTAGTMKACLVADASLSEDEAIARAKAWEGLDGQDYAAKVSADQEYLWDPEGTKSTSWGITETLPETDLHIVAFDFGIKWNILRGLRRHGMNVTVVPAKTSAAEVLAKKPDGVFLSNGPADPAAVTYAADAIRELLGKVPLMGICLGHQLLGLALGGITYRLKFGHHGCNHPVKNLRTGSVEITSQNHNFAIREDSIDRANVEITHINLNDQTIEGIRHKTEPAFSVQYHPEAAPGPHDPYYLFAQFRQMIEQA